MKKLFTLILAMFLVQGIWAADFSSVLGTSSNELMEKKPKQSKKAKKAKKEKTKKEKSDADGGSDDE